MVLIGYYAGNDHRILLDEKFKGQYKVKEKEYRFFSSFVLKKYSNLIATLNFSRRQPSGEEMKYVSGMFRDFANYSKVHDIPVIVVYLTARTDHSVRPELIRDISKEHGLGFIDVSRDFDQKNNGKYAIYLTNFHPNAKANKKFA